MSNWQKEMTDTIGAQVKKLRGDRTAVWLANRTAELGMKVSRSAISDLEGERRRSISVAELLVLAAALKVPPALLLFPNFPDGQTEYLPNRETTAFNASQWLSGEVMPSESGELAEGHRQVVRARDRNNRRESRQHLINMITNAENDDQRKFWQDQLETTEKLIRIQNREMRRDGGTVEHGEG